MVFTRYNKLRSFTEKKYPLCILCFLSFRMVVSMVYYGLSLNTGNLGGSFYINFLISGLVEFPAYTLCLILLDRTGRKWLHAASMILGGLCCICTVFTTVFGGDSKPWFHLTFHVFTIYSCFLDFTYLIETIGLCKALITETPGKNTMVPGIAHGFYK